MKWLQCFKRRTNELARNAAPEIAVGSLWVLRATDNDPFPARTDLPPVVILGVQNGWVRYGYPIVFTDQRMEVDMFLHCYKPKEAV